ncbi:MAG TPA: Stk1 family PASTA domain-containing Ser/Thr kinase [Nocardioidaceae bacterium]|nr:Stk1 family PASTA domain-containing Ser/Thr kinase [Nocardioidaceae bacterium]
MSTEHPSGARLLVGDRYELGELLGRGGMAEVRKGTDVRLGRVVAVKRLRTDLAGDSTFQARFRREAQSSASLNHHSIVSVYDTGEEPSGDGSGVPQPYIVMEYVAGRTLRDILREGRKILPERALEITSGVLEALDYSHRAGIVHRDIKPANVMLTPSGDVKVMDFGIARAIADSTSTMTQTAAVVGTAQYLSPEQARGETVDSRSDVYSTGCLLYELLTGRPPFVGESPVSVAYQHVREQALPPSSLDDELPPEIDAIVMKALAKPLVDRYQSAAAMRADIERYLAGKPVVAPVVPVPDLGGAVGEAPTAMFTPTATTVREPERRRRWPLVVTIIAAVVLTALAAVLGPLLLSSAPEDKTVPQVVNLTQAQAEQRIREAGLTVGRVTPEASEDVPRDRVLAQDPVPLSTLTANGPVDLTVSTGRPDVVVPFVIGLDKDAARQEITDAGLEVRLVEEDADEEADTVIRTEPNASKQVSSGSLVTVFYSAGPREVPSVVGLQVRQARSRLREAGFEVDVVLDAATESEKGTVLQQTPAAFTTPPRGTTVVLTVSDFETPSPTPTPTETPTETPTGTATPEESDPPQETPADADQPEQ